MMNGTRLSKTKMKVFFLQLMKRRIVQKSPFSRTNRKYFQCAIHPGPLHTAYVPWLTPVFSRRPPTIVPEACTPFPSLGVPSGLLLGACFKACEPLHSQHFNRREMGFRTAENSLATSLTRQQPLLPLASQTANS